MGNYAKVSSSGRLEVDGNKLFQDPKVREDICVLRSAGRLLDRLESLEFTIDGLQHFTLPDGEQIDLTNAKEVMDLVNAKIKLALYTTLQDASTHIDGESVLWWRRSIDGWYFPIGVYGFCPSSACRWWTPIPMPISDPKE